MIFDIFCFLRDINNQSINIIAIKDNAEMMKYLSYTCKADATTIDGTRTGMVKVEHEVDEPIKHR